METHAHFNLRPLGKPNTHLGILGLAHIGPHGNLLRGAALKLPAHIWADAAGLGGRWHLQDRWSLWGLLWTKAGWPWIPLS